MIQTLRWLFLLVAGELVKMAMEPTLRRKLPAVYAVVDAKLRHAYQKGVDKEGVEAIIRESVVDVTRKIATREDVKAIVSLFDPTLLPGR